MSMIPIYSAERQPSPSKSIYVGTLAAVVVLTAGLGSAQIGCSRGRSTAAQAILKNLGWRFCSMAKLVFGLNQSLDGYVDHQEFAPGPSLFRHFIEQVRGLTGSVYGRRMYEVMRYWDEDHPEWDAEERDFAAAWRSQPKWVVSRSLKSVGPNATLVEDDIEAVIRGLKAQLVGEIASCRTRPSTKPNRPWSY